MNRRTTITNLSFLLFVVVLLTLSFLSYRRIIRQSEAAEWVDHSYLSKLTLENSFRRLFLLESYQRGFIITHDSAYLKEYAVTKSYLPTNFKRLDSLLADDGGEQLRNLVIVKDLFRQRINWMEFVIDSHRKDPTANIASIFAIGKNLTDSVSTYIVKMNIREDEALNKRLKVKEYEEIFSSRFVLILSVFAISAIFFSFLRLKKESNLLMASNVEKNILEIIVTERTKELLSANEQLNRQNTELEQKNAELNSFTFIASHDLKEPLRKIETYASRILKDDEDRLSENGKRYFTKIVDSIQRMKNLIDSIFSYAQVEQEMEYEKTDLMKIMADVVSSLSDAIEEKNALISFDNLPVFNAIPEQMEQLFTNLINNSLKYSQSAVAPVIRINAASEQGDGGMRRWKIEFTDNGVGFDEKYKDKIFQIFQRAHSRAQYSGTGIGLAICKKIVENHHGSITAQSSPGAGAVFTVVFPEKL